MHADYHACLKCTIEVASVLGTRDWAANRTTPVLSSVLSVIARLPRCLLGRNAAVWGECPIKTDENALRAERFGLDLDLHKSAFVFAGDSPNDQPMFGYFPHSVGVANVKNLLDLISSKPTYVTDSACGAGFIEIATALLTLRGASVPAR